MICSAGYRFFGIPPPFHVQSVPKPLTYQLDRFKGGRSVRTAFWQLEENTATPKSGVGEQRDVKALFRDYHNLAQLWAYQGNLEQTVKYLQAAHGEALSLGDKEVLLELEEKLGIAYLRWGEIENSVHTAHVKSCLFPMEGRGPLKGTAGWESAIKHFQRFLEEKPEDLEVKWLLNLAYMALGRYPDGVPKQYLIPLGPFESKQDVGQFVDVAPCALSLATHPTIGDAATSSAPLNALDWVI